MVFHGYEHWCLFCKSFQTPPSSTDWTVVFLRLTIEEKSLLGASVMFDEFQMFLAASADVNALNS